MRSWVRQNAGAVLGASLGIYVVSWLALTDWAWNDYDNEARPAFDALVSGHVLQFLKLAPAYGGSLVMRAPFVLIPKLWAGGELAVYRAAAAPCLAATGILGVWLAARMRAEGTSKLARAVAVMLCAANPITLLALESGHPEELLGGVLCVAAVVVAMGDRPLWAGVLLGIAVANQEWAIVATGPVLIALPGRRIRALAAAGAVAVLVLLPLVAAGTFVSRVKGAATPDNLIFSPWQIWWFLGPHLHAPIPGEPQAVRLEPGWLSQLAHPLIVAVALPLTCLCVWRRRRQLRRPAQEALLLLVFLLLLRCALDPWDNWYYPLPFLLALVVWEALSYSRPPVFGLVASCAIWVLTQWAIPAHGFSPDAQSVVFLVLALPAVVAVTAALYGPGLSERIRLRVTRRDLLASPA